MPFEEKTIFVTEKEVICKKIFFFYFIFFLQKNTLFVPEKYVTIIVHAFMRACVRDVFVKKL